MSDSDSDEITLDTQFVPQDNDDETLWEVIEILAERKHQYRVRWDGIDPATNKPWAPSWVSKHDCTDELVKEWKKKQLRQKKEREAAKAQKTTARKDKPSTKTQGKGKEAVREQSAEIPILVSETTSQPTSAKLTRPHTRPVQNKVNPLNQPGPSRVTRSSSISSSATKAPHRPAKRKRVPPAADEEAIHESPDKGLLLPVTAKIGPPRTKKRRIESSFITANVSSHDDATAYVGNRIDSSALAQEEDQVRQRSGEQAGQSSEDEDSGQARLQAVSDSHHQVDGVASSTARKSGVGREDGDRSVAERRGEEDSRFQLTPRELDVSPSSVPDVSSWESNPFVALPPDNVRDKDDSKGEVIPETQPSQDQEEDGEDVFMEDAYDPKQQYPPHPQTPPQLQRTADMKQLHPVPVISPSVFKPYLPGAPVTSSQETIEQFSSPEVPKRRTAARSALVKAQKLPLREINATRAPGVTNGIRQSSLPNLDSRRGPISSVQDPDAIVRSMEADYLDMTGGLPSPAQIEPSDRAQPPGPGQRAQDQDDSTITPFNATSSTQRAVIDSQSQTNVVPDSNSWSDWETQLASLQAQLKTSQSAVSALREDVRSREEELVEVKTRLQTSEETVIDYKRRVRTQSQTIVSLQKEIGDSKTEEDTLKATIRLLTTEQDELNSRILRYQESNEELCLRKEAVEQEARLLAKDLLEARQKYDELWRSRPAANADENSDEGYSDGSSSSSENIRPTVATLSKELLASEARVVELEAHVQQLRTEGVILLRKQYDTQVRQLEGEVAQWRGLCGVMRKKDERTDDEIRRRAGEEPELRKKLSELETEKDKLVEERALLLEEKDGWIDEVERLQAKIEQLEAEKLEWPLRQAEMAHAWRSEAHKAFVSESAKVASTGEGRPRSGWSVCMEIQDGRECLQRFRNMLDWRSHIREDHYDYKVHSPQSTK